MGLDGVYRTAGMTIDGIAPAARGEWQDCTFVLDLSLVGKIDRYRMELRLGDQAQVRVAERTGLAAFQVDAHPQPR